MKVSSFAIMIGLLVALCAGSLYAQQSSLLQPSSITQTSLAYDSYYAQEDAEASPSDQPAPAAAPHANHAPNGNGGCACNSCGQAACNGCCEDGCCDDGCCLFGNCSDLGDAWTLNSHLHPCGDSWVNVGGWVTFGYHDDRNGLFNNHPHRFNNHQSWVYLEKKAETGEDWDWGYRFSAMYGVDGQDTQSFGNNPGRWDFQNGFDHGIYAWALPEAFADVTFGDLRVRMGHFYTKHGYEVVAAPYNFFYSHSLTFFLSEPFTHTGVLADYALSEDVSVVGGWTLGWDTGFDQFDQGSSFMGGFALPLVEDVKFSYIVMAGNFGKRGREAYSHTLLFDWTVSEKWEYVAQSDLLRLDSTGEDNIGICQYLFYTINDCFKVGGRVEWWKGDDVTNFTFGGNIPSGPDSSASYYEATFGVNIKPQANIVLRPEIRYDWAPFADYAQSIFGVDVVATF
jgi:hypothetical protein